MIRDCTYLTKGLQPLEESGRLVEKLGYELKKEHAEEEGNSLNCQNICELADAFEGNLIFKGDLDLKRQPLTDIAAMHIGRILSSGCHLTKLDISQKPKDCKFTHKAGEYIG